MGQNGKTGIYFHCLQAKFRDKAKKKKNKNQIKS